MRPIMYAVLPSHKVIRDCNFPVKKPEHHHMPQFQKTFVDSIVLVY